MILAATRLPLDHRTKVRCHRDFKTGALLHLESARTKSVPCYYSRGFAGIPHPPFVTPSWRLLLTQPSPVLANFEPIASVLMTSLLFAPRTVTPEVQYATLRRLPCPGSGPRDDCGRSLPRHCTKAL